VKKHLALLAALALPGYAVADCVAPRSIGGIRYVIEADAATPAELEANPWQFDADGYLIWREGMPEWMRGARRIDDLSEFVEFDPNAPWMPLPPPRKMGQGNGGGDPVLLGCGDDPVDGERVEVRARRVGTIVFFHNRPGLYFAPSGTRAGSPISDYTELGDRVHNSQIRMGCDHSQVLRTAAANVIAGDAGYPADTIFVVAFTSRVHQLFVVTSADSDSVDVAPYSECLGEGG
jgi:hypothetical protein